MRATILPEAIILTKVEMTVIMICQLLPIPIRENPTVSGRFITILYRTFF